MACHMYVCICCQCMHKSSVWGTLLPARHVLALDMLKDLREEWVFLPHRQHPIVLPLEGAVDDSSLHLPVIASLLGASFKS